MAKANNKPMTPPIDTTDHETKLISLAYRQAEKELEQQTASSQVVKHFLDLGKAKAELESRKLEYEIKLLEAKIKSEESTQNIQQLYENVLEALQSYSMAVPYDDR